MTQKPAINYFELLDLPVTVALDASALQKAYVRAQQQCHPDRMIGKSDVERAKAMQLSVDVNHAYHVLKSLRLRAEHLLAMQGIVVNKDGGDAVRPSQGLLMEVMQWQERVADEDAGIFEELTAVRTENEQKIARYLDAQELESAAQAVIRQRYIEKALEDAAR